MRHFRSVPTLYINKLKHKTIKELKIQTKGREDL